jgi:anti-sigma B factor antagonist
MDTTIERRGRNSVVSVSGRITIDSSPDLRILLLKQLKTRDFESLTVDLYDVAYVDVSGLAVLLEVLKAAQAGSRAFHLSGLRERPRFLLEATRLLHLFHEVPR